MSFIKKSFYLATGLAVVSTRALQKTVEKLIEEGEKYYEGKPTPLEKMKEKMNDIAEEGEDKLKDIRNKVYDLLGVTPVDQVEKLEKRLSQLEQKLVTDAAGSDS